MTQILDFVTFLVVSVANIFTALDNVPFGDAGFSLLDVFIAILCLDLIVWFMLRLYSADAGEE